MGLFPCQLFLLFLYFTALKQSGNYSRMYSYIGDRVHYSFMKDHFSHYSTKIYPSVNS